MSKLINLTKEQYIDFIKQNAPAEYYDAINDLHESKFVFLNYDNSKQCFITIENDDNTRTQLVFRFINGYCLLTDLNDLRKDLSTQWKKFAIREEYLKKKDGQNPNAQPRDNSEYKKHIDFKDCIVSYMIEFQTPIAAHTEIEDWSMFLQNHIDNAKLNYEVMNDNNHVNSFRKKQDALLTSTQVGYILNDYHDEDDLNTYLLQENFDPELLSELISAQGKYRQIISPNSMN